RVCRVLALVPRLLLNINRRAALPLPHLPLQGLAPSTGMITRDCLARPPRSRRAPTGMSLTCRAAFLPLVRCFARGFGVEGHYRPGARDLRLLTVVPESSLEAVAPLSSGSG